MQERDSLSRREFLSLSLKIGTGFLLAETTGLLGTVEYVRRKRIPEGLSALEKFPDELFLYGREGVRLIRTIETNLNLSVSLPNAYRLPQGCEGAGVTDILVDELNKEWSISELRTLAFRATTLPPAFKMEKKAILAKYQIGGIQFGGCMDGGFIGLLIPQEFIPSMPNIWRQKRWKWTEYLFMNLPTTWLTQNKS